MQEKLLSQKNFQGGVQLVSLSMNKVVRANKFLCGGGYPCDGLASHAGGSRNTLSRCMLQKQG